MTCEDGKVDGPSERVVEQRVRNRVIEYLELTSSLAAQADYEKSVPIAYVPYEVINQWEDQLPRGPHAIVEPDVYTAEELESSKRFHVVWETTADALPDDYPPLDVVLGLSQWESLRKAAESALATFALRGKLPEDHAAV